MDSTLVANQHESHNNNQTASSDDKQPTTDRQQPQQQQPPPRDDVRVDFIRKLLVRTFPSVKLDKLNKLFASESVAGMLFDFLHAPDVRLLFFTDTGSDGANLRAFVQAPTKLPAGVTVLYLVKTAKAAVSADPTKCADELLSGTLETNALESLARVLREVFVPLIGNQRNQRLWPEMVTTSVINNVHGFFSSLQITVGQTKGATCLPLPWDQILHENNTMLSNLGAPSSPSARNSSGTGGSTAGNTGFATSSSGSSAAAVKDQVHGLEGCLITWTKQIKNILKQDPESTLNKRNVHPGPLEELNFWQAKSKNLNSIFDQLQSDSIRKVLQYLDASKSTYNVPFAKLCKEVFAARAEANDNIHFLSPLRPWFAQLASPSEDFPAVRDLFRPILHSLLMVWKCSRFYNTPTRLVVLMRQICNELIRKALAFLNGKLLFELIAADEMDKADAMLLQSLQVCAHLKSVYYDYKAKSSVECPANPWRIQNNALFVRLDAFLERCHDVLELTQTIMQFQKLSKIEIGGTKGKTIIAAIKAVHADFAAAHERFQQVRGLSAF